MASLRFVFSHLLMKSSSVLPAYLPELGLSSIYNEKKYIYKKVLRKLKFIYI